MTAGLSAECTDRTERFLIRSEAVMMAAIFGLSPWTTPLELWMIKKGRMKPPVKANSSQLEMGHLLEPIAAYWYAKRR